MGLKPCPTVPFQTHVCLTLHVILRITSICFASHCILTCITIIAFLHASPSYGILTCITIMLHSYMYYHYIALHSLMHAFHLHQKNSFHLFCPEISNCLLDARSELQG